MVHVERKCQCMEGGACRACRVARDTVEKWWKDFRS